MMKGKRLIGLIIAGVLLVFVVCALVFGGEEPAVWTLPVIAAGVWAMTIVDTIAYRTEPYEGMQKKNEFVRIVGGYIFAVILTVISVIFAVMGEF